MKNTRIIVTHYGGPEALQVVEEECREPKRGEVRVKVLAAGVALPDLLAREGVHPETPRVPFTPAWGLVGVIDQLGDGVSGIEPGQIVAAMPISGAYAEFVCLPQRELVPVPQGLEAAEAVCLLLNYITAYRMLHRSAKGINMSAATANDSIRNYEALVGTETRWVFEVEDCHRFYDLASKRGVKFIETPVDQPWGVSEAMFEDLYGNLFVVESFRPKT